VPPHLKESGKKKERLLSLPFFFRSLCNLEKKEKRKKKKKPPCLKFIFSFVLFIFCIIFLFFLQGYNAWDVVGCDKYKNLCRWLKACEERPASAKAMLINNPWTPNGITEYHSA
jgi:hypothetical protein